MENKKVNINVFEISRTLMSFENTNPNIDKKDCYERIVMNDKCVWWESVYGKTVAIHRDNPFFNELEEMYKEAISKNNEE